MSLIGDEDARTPSPYKTHQPKWLEARMGTLDTAAVVSTFIASMAISNFEEVRTFKKDDKMGDGWLQVYTFTSAASSVLFFCAALLFISKKMALQRIMHWKGDYPAPSDSTHATFTRIVRKWKTPNRDDTPATALWKAAHFSRMATDALPWATILFIISLIIRSCAPFDGENVLIGVIAATVFGVVGIPTIWEIFGLLAIADCDPYEILGDGIFEDIHYADSGLYTKRAVDLASLSPTKENQNSL